MNITPEEFLRSLEESVRELPSVLREWDQIDGDLRVEYADQLAWLLDHEQEALERARKHGNVRQWPTAMRLAVANRVLFDLADVIREKMGIRVDGLTRGLTASPHGADARAADEPQLAMAI